MPARKAPAGRPTVRRAASSPTRSAGASAASKAPASPKAAAPVGPTKAVRATKVSTAPEAAEVPKAAKVPKVPKALKAPKTPKPPKGPKLRQKPVRDSFTMPEADFSLIATLKARAIAGHRETRKSELLRAGLHALAAMDSPALLAALGALEAVKIGRPKKGH